MPITAPDFANAPTAYLRANGLLNKAPIYIISFGPITGPLGTNYQPLADEYCTAPVLNPTKARKALLNFPSGYSSEFNPVTYQSTLSSISFDISDNNPQYPGEATRLITNYVLKNRWVTIKRGFITVSEAAYTIIYAGQINNVKMNKSNTGFTFELIDPRKMMTQTILDGHSALTSPYFSGHSSMIVANTNGFASFTAALAGSTCTCYIRLGTNLFSYTGITTSGAISDGGALWQYVGPGGPISVRPAWQAFHFYTHGDIVYSNGGVFSFNGGSGGSGGTAPYGVGDFDAGGGVFWLWLGFNAGDYLQWQPNQPVAVNMLVTNFGNRYICTVAGTTGNTGGPVGDGSLSTGGTFTGLSFVTPDGQGIVPGVDGAIGENVDNFVNFHGHPIDIILGIILSTGTNTATSGSPNGLNHDPSGATPNYDVNPLGLGIGVPWQQVNIANFLVQKTAMGAMTFNGYFQDSYQALKFIEDFILPQAHLFIYPNRNGQIDCRAIFDTLDMTGAITLDETNIVGIPTFDSNLQSGGYFYNQPTVSYDYKVVQGYYSSILVQPEAASWGAYQEIANLPIDGRMFDSLYGGAALVATNVATYLSRFALPPPMITLKTFDVMTLLDPHSSVILNHKAIPNFQTGQRGGPINCQVIKVAPDWSSGAMNVVLLAFGWYG